MPTLVIRFSSLGDVVLAGAVTGGLAPVHLLTRAPFTEVAALLPGVERVLVWEEGPDLSGYERIVDLHHSPRSRALAMRLRGPISRVERYDLRRRMRVALKVGAPPPRVVERYARAAGVSVAPLPWIPLPSRAREALALAPAAAHATKRWPAERFTALGRRWPGPVVVLGGPEDHRLTRGVAEAIGPRAEAIAERGFSRTLDALARARLLVGGDTGLLHLAGACGLPVVGLFGPTTALDGFWCWHERGEAVELDLSCRPCSLHGGPVCPIGDHLCLQQLEVDSVWAAVERVLDSPCAR